MHYGGSEKRDAFFPAPKPVANHNIALFLLGLLISAMQMKNSFRLPSGPLEFVRKKKKNSTNVLSLSCYLVAVVMQNGGIEKYVVALFSFWWGSNLLFGLFFLVYDFLPHLKISYL